MNKTIDFSTAKDTDGLQEILNLAYRALGNPIFVFNMEYELMAHSDGADNDDRICAEFMEFGKLGPETLEFFKNECFIDAVASCDGVTCLISDKLKYDRIFGQLYNKKQAPVADLVIVACEKPFAPDTKDLIKELCAVISKNFAKDEFFQIYGHIYQETIIKKLIEKDVENKGIYAGHVANIYSGLKDNVFVAVADMGKPGLDYDKLAQCRNAFESACPEFKYFVYSDRIIALISSESVRLSAECPRLKKLCRFAKSKGITIGVSECFENLYNLHIYYEQAAQALRDKQNSIGDDLNLFVFESSAARD